MEHTKGPWQVGYLVENDFEPRHIEIKGADGVKLIAKAVYGRTDEECATNAHLIAKAPEILEALKGLILWTNTTAKHHLDADMLPVGLERWEDLIAKIEGK